MMFFNLYKKTPIIIRSGINSPKKVNILEVGPRDGLQNETKILSIETRLEFIQRLLECNLSNIEIGSMSNPKYIPQMKDSHHLANILPKHSSNYYSMLIPNMNGFQTLLKSNASNNVNEVLFNVATSETFNLKNMGRTIDKTLTDINQMKDLAIQNNLNVRLSISTVWGCPFEKNDNWNNLNKILDFCKENNISTIDLADTISNAKPDNVYKTFEHAIQKLPNCTFAAHMHNIDDIGIKNVEAALLAGITTIHSSLLGIGGCPNSSLRAGNIDTLELVKFLDERNIEHGVNIEKLIITREWLKNNL